MQLPAQAVAGPARYLWWYLPRAFSPGWCDRVVALAERAGPSPSTVNNGHHSESRRSRSAFIEPSHEDALLYTQVMNAARQINAMAFALDIEFPEPLQYVEYSAESQGSVAPRRATLRVAYRVALAFAPHVDIFWERAEPTDRKLSLSIQLTPRSGYDGGELLVVGARLPDAAYEQGSVIGFPSYIMHEVRPVTRGLRRALIAWVRGPRCRSATRDASRRLPRFTCFR